jgi:hypothetical protein
LIRFHEADENSATEMGRIMAHLRSLASAGASILVQHHKPKNEGARYRGTGDIKAGVDLCFDITFDKTQQIITMECFKNRFGEEIKIALKPQFGKNEVFKITSDPTFESDRTEERIVRGIIEKFSPLSQMEILEQAGLPKHKTRAILKRGEGTLWRSERAPRGRLDYYPLKPDASFSAFQPFNPEKLNSSPEGARVIEGML